MEKFVQINIRVYGVCKPLTQCPMAKKNEKIGGIKMKSKNNKNRRKVEIGVNEGVHNEGAEPC